MASGYDVIGLNFNDVLEITKPIWGCIKPIISSMLKCSSSWHHIQVYWYLSHMHCTFLLRNVNYKNRKWRCLRKAPSHLTLVDYEIQNPDGMEELENVLFFMVNYVYEIYTPIEALNFGIYIYIYMDFISENVKLFLLFHSAWKLIGTSFLRIFWNNSEHNKVYRVWICHISAFPISH